MDEIKQRTQALKERLVQYRQMELEIDLQLERLARYEARFLTAEPKELTGMPPGGDPPGDKLGSYVAQKEELEASIRRTVDEQRREKQYLEGCLGYLKSAREKAVIRMRYFDSCSWSDVVDAIFGGEENFEDRKDTYLRRVHKIHGSALKNMSAVMLELEEKALERAKQEQETSTAVLSPA